MGRPDAPGRTTAMKAMAKMIGGTTVLLGALAFTGCGGGPTSPDAAADRTAAGIRVIGVGSELHPVIDQRWTEVEKCWGVAQGGEQVSVTVQEPERYDSLGQGVIRVDGNLVYGLRVGNQVWVATDLAALRHEFSHVIGERATGRPVSDGDGRCWL